MNNELYAYLQRLHAFVSAQERRIQNLEATVIKLKEEIDTLNNRPAINVDKIEYKFDQLKVETLDGTLNIGLNPSDLQNIDDFAVDNQSIQTPISPKTQLQRSIEIEDHIFHYVENDLPSVIAEVEKKLNINIDESCVTFIKEDIKKQLPTRIDFYIRQFQELVRGNKEKVAGDINSFVIDKLIKEIKNGVHTFISHLPENMKGMKNE